MADELSLTDDVIMHLHCLEVVGGVVGECHRVTLAHGGARYEEVDTKVRVITFYRLADVLKITMTSQVYIRHKCTYVTGVNKLSFE